MEGQAQNTALFHAALRAMGTLLPPGEERKHPTLRLEGGGLEGELQLKPRCLSPKARRRLTRALRDHPAGAAVGVLLWPRTKEGRLELKASQVGLLHLHPRPELAGTFSALGLPQAWEAAGGRLLLEIQPNLKGGLHRPFALELFLPEGLQPPALEEGQALWVEGRLEQGRLVAGRLTPTPRPEAKPQPAPAPGPDGAARARRRRVQARPPS